jgi:hypothetical protein
MELACPYYALTQTEYQNRGRSQKFYIATQEEEDDHYSSFEARTLFIRF